MKKNILFSGIYALLLLSLLLLYNAVVFVLFTPQAMDITGDKSFVDAKVYASNGRNIYTKETLIAIMTWDEKDNLTYAQDIRSLNGDILYKLTIHAPNRYTDQFEMPSRISDKLDFKVITKDNKVYVYHAYNEEDLWYDSYSLKNFERIK